MSSLQIISQAKQIVSNAAQAGLIRKVTTEMQMNFQLIAHAQQIVADARQFGLIESKPISKPMRKLIIRASDFGTWTDQKGYRRLYRRLYMAIYRQRNLEKIRLYNREAMRRFRAKQKQLSQQSAISKRGWSWQKNSQSDQLEAEFSQRNRNINQK